MRTVLPTSFASELWRAYGADFWSGPDSLLSGVENPVRLATPRFSTLDGELFLSPSKEATPWQTVNNSAYAARRHIQTEINRRLFRASRVAQIMHINMLHERSHALSNIYSASVFSYLADDLRELQQLFQQQNKLH